MYECLLKSTLIECTNCDLIDKEDLLMCAGKKSIYFSERLLKISCESFEELIKLKNMSLK